MEILCFRGFLQSQNKIPHGSCVKYRKKLILYLGFINFLKIIYFEIYERYCFKVDAIGTDGNHVHLFVGAELKYSPSKVMQIIKSITVEQIFKQYP